jgi:hypothetical protein
MPWVRFDDQFPIHRKTAGLSDAAFRLHVAAIFWCARNLTDGFVPREDLDDVCARVRTPTRFAGELVVRGLWHLRDEDCPSGKCIAPATGDGWVVHDYLEYQPSADRVREDRADGARRQQEWRDRKRNAVSNGVSNGGSNTTPSRTRTRPEVLPPTDSLRSSVPPEGAEHDAAKPKTKRATRIPDDFAITEEMRDWGRKRAPHVNGELETEKFVNYWKAKSGAAATKIDWERTWQNWILNAAERTPSGPRTRDGALQPSRAGVNAPRPVAEVLAEQARYGSEPQYLPEPWPDLDFGRMPE